MKRGITLGKFWPLHLGHDLMIQSGINTMDHMTVLIANDSDYKNSIVYNQMKARYGDKCTIVSHVDNEPTPELDANGTSKDKDYLNRWAARIKRIDKNVNYIITSDLYGKELADILGVEWFPIDPQRKVIPISATIIKSDLFSYWDYIVPEAKNHWSKKIAIVGAESCGKSTMVDYFEKHFYGIIHGIPEYGRTISEVKKNKLTGDDFEHIVFTQNQMIKSAINQYPFILTDTEALTTHLFADLYLSKTHATAFNFYEELDVLDNEIDHYIVLAPTVPWVNDGWRVIDKQEEREKFHNRLIEKLEKYKLKYTVIDDSDWNIRLTKSINKVSQLIEAV